MTVDNKGLYQQVEAAHAAKDEAQKAFEVAELEAWSASNALAESLAKQHGITAGMKICNRKTGLAGAVDDLVLSELEKLTGDPEQDLTIQLVFSDGPLVEHSVKSFWEEYRQQGDNEPFMAVPHCGDLQAILCTFDRPLGVSYHRNYEKLFGDLHCTSKEAADEVVAAVTQAGWSHELIRMLAEEDGWVVRVHAVPKKTKEF